MSDWKTYGYKRVNLEIDRDMNFAKYIFQKVCNLRLGNVTRSKRNIFFFLYQKKLYVDGRNMLDFKR